MNERIRELGKQLGITDPEGNFYSPNYEIFAEAIIRECARVVDRVYETAPPDYGCYDWTTWAYGSNILEHFGIKDE